MDKRMRMLFCIVAMCFPVLAASCCDKPKYAKRESVDLGLSVKWATMNVGAKSPEQPGDYYAWGEIATKDRYDWPSYHWSEGSYDELLKYLPVRKDGKKTMFTDGRTVLEPEDDIAHVRWGGQWRMPTVKEQDELREKCKWKWTTLNGRKGFRVTGPNGNSIFLPTTGYRHYGFYADKPDIIGDYWSCSLDPDQPVCAWYLNFDSKKPGKYHNERFLGFAIRAVCPK